MTASPIVTEATRTVGRSKSRRRVAERKSRRSTLLTVFVWITLIYFLVPLLWLFLSTTKNNGDLFITFGLWFGNSFQFFNNIGQLFVFQGGVFWQWMANTVLYAVVSAVGAAALATACGFALAKYRFRGQSAVFAVILGSIMVPLTALALPTYLLFAKANLTDSVWAIILPSLVSPFGVYLMRVYAAGRGRRQPSRGRQDRRCRRVPDLLHHRAAPAHTRPRDGAAVPARRDLEQLLPALDHAEHAILVPGDRRPRLMAGDRLRWWWCAGALLDRADRVVRVDRPARRRVPVPPALLAVGSRDGWREGMTMNRLWYGGDYNPEQWPREVWDDDVRLMQRAGVTIATVGVFSWARLEPRDGEFDFEWLDDVLDRLHAGGIRVDLATATASPPPWLALAHPEMLPVTEDGVRLSVGSRQHYSPSSAVYRRYADRLVRALAERYRRHPALEAWHVNNELACHVQRDFSDESAVAFRAWLTAKYGTVETLNEAWGTQFWSQAYGSFEEVVPPRAAPTFRNPTQLLDFDRFSSDAWLAVYEAEAAILREVSPGVPITTNFMGFFKGLDYWKHAAALDFVSDDHYPDPADPEAPMIAAATRDLIRSLAGGPWILMEQAPNAVNWRPRNAAKPDGMHRLLSLQAVARGADGIMQFQWRQSKAGAEKFHSAMVPTPARTAGSTARRSRSARTWPLSPTWSARSRTPASRSCSTGTAGGRSSRRRRPPPSPTPRSCCAGTASSGGAACSSTSRGPARTCPGTRS